MNQDNHQIREFAGGTPGDSHAADGVVTGTVEDDISGALNARLAEITAVPGTIEDEISRALNAGIAQATASPGTVEDEISAALDAGIAEITGEAGASLG